MIKVFPEIRHEGTQEHEHKIQILDAVRPEAGSDMPPTLSLLIDTGDDPPHILRVSFERWPRIMTEIVRKLAEGNGARASHILDEMDAALFDGSERLKP